MFTQYKHYSKTNNVINIKLYNVGIYARISREDDNNVSESIINQVEFLERIVLENGWNLIDTYKDDGVSGTTFDRTDFNRLISDIEKGKINMVITKDLSRLGRDYIQTGYYLENYFPTKNIRYIAVNDGIDTFNEDSNSDFMPFKSVFNDMYARDISKKVRTALRTKQDNGSYLGTVAPFGYLKCPCEKGKLIIDPVSSVFVKRIFKDFLSGVPLKNISNQLTADKVPTPSGYRNIQNTQKRFLGVWNDTTVRRIIKNEAYIGHTVQNKKKKISYKIDKQIDVPQSQWIKVENTHEPIIPLQDFKTAQQVLAKRSYQPKNGNLHLFTGFAFCGYCGSPIAHSNQHQKGKYYIVCSTVKKHKTLNLCKPRYLREEYLKDCILKTLKNIATEYIDTGIISDGLSQSISSDNLKYNQQAVKDVQKRIEDITTVSMSLYKDKISGVITNEVFQQLMAQSNAERESNVAQLQVLEKEMQQITQIEGNHEQAKSMLEQFLQFNDINRTILAMLIKKIVIYHDNTVDIDFTFKKPVHKNLL